MKAEGLDVVGFGAGEPDFDTPQHIKDAAAKALAEGFNKYTPSSDIAELRQAIADKFKRDNGLSYKCSQIIVSCGGKHSLWKNPHTKAVEAVPRHATPNLANICPAKSAEDFPSHSRPARKAIRMCGRCRGDLFGGRPELRHYCYDDRGFLWPLLTHVSESACSRAPAVLIFNAMKRFGQVLEWADELSPDEQESLVSILQRRLREQRRAELVKAVKEARKEFKTARVRPAAPAEIIKKIPA